MRPIVLAKFKKLANTITHRAATLMTFTRTLVTGGLSMCLLTGCANFLFGENAMSRNPIENPTVNVTNFTRSLECMDNLLIQHDAPRITITAQDVPNMTGDGNSIAGTKDMLITSISKLSQRSRRIRFVSYGTDLRDIILLHKAHEGRDNFVTPDYFIRGAITQLDKNVMSSRIGAAANDDSWNAAFSGGQGVSFIGLDLNIGLVSSLQMIPGVTSNNVLALWDRGAGTDIGGRINSVGTFFDFGIDRRDGLGQAVRNMTDLAVIEIVGKLLDLPYLTCLPLNHHSPAVQALIHTEYQRYSENPRKLIRTVQAKLKHFNYYQGPVHGVMDRPTSLALEYFRNLYQPYSHTGGTGALDFDLYYQIMYGQRYAWHFDALPYGHQQRLASHPVSTTPTIPQALHYNSNAAPEMRSSSHEARRLEERYRRTQYQPQTRPTQHSQPQRPAPVRNHNKTTQDYSPPSVATESYYQQHRSRAASSGTSPLPTPPQIQRRTRLNPVVATVPAPHTPQTTQTEQPSRQYGNTANASPRPLAGLPHQTTQSGFEQTPLQVQENELPHQMPAHTWERQNQPGNRNAQYGYTDDIVAIPSGTPPYEGPATQGPREAAFGLPQAPRQKNWPLENQRYPYERGDSWDRSITQDVQLYEHYRP